MKTKWNEKSVVDKILFVLRIIVSIAVLIGAALQLLGVWDRALNIAVPLLSALILIQSIQEQKENRKASAITSGGSQAMFFKINTFGEEAFLDKLREISRRKQSWQICLEI